MAELINSHKNIAFSVGDESITNLFIQTTEINGCKQSQIKFSIKSVLIESIVTDKYFLITSLNPLKVFTGLAGTYLQSPETMWDCEDELIEEVLKWDSKKIYQLTQGAKDVRVYWDFFNGEQEVFDTGINI